MKGAQYFYQVWDLYQFVADSWKCFVDLALKSMFLFFLFLGPFFFRE